MIGEVNASFRFASERVARVAWQRVSERCRYISVYRWAIDPADVHGAQAVTVLCEDAQRPTLQRACRLLAPGEPFDPDPEILGALRSRRAQVDAAGGGRRVVRHPEGYGITRDGIDLGPVRRPQG